LGGTERVRGRGGHRRTEKGVGEISKDQANGRKKMSTQGDRGKTGKARKGEHLPSKGTVKIFNSTQIRVWGQYAG